MRVSIFGLGYVGCVSAASLAAEGHEIVGVDVNPEKVGAINEGRSPIVEPGLEELLKRGVAQKRLRATTDTSEAVCDSPCGSGVFRQGYRVDSAACSPLEGRNTSPSNPAAGGRSAG